MWEGGREEGREGERYVDEEREGGMVFKNFILHTYS